MNKIKRLSTIFRILFQLAFIILPIILALYWIFAPSSFAQANGFSLSFLPSSVHIMYKLTASTKLLGFLINLIPVGISMLILYFLIKLFRLYEQGAIFTINNVRYIKNIGYTMLIGQLLNPIYDLLISFALTFKNPPGHRYALITLDNTNIAIIVTAFIIILIAWIMAEGCKLREEQDYTV